MRVDPDEIESVPLPRFKFRMQLFLRLEIGLSALMRYKNDLVLPFCRPRHPFRRRLNSLFLRLNPCTSVLFQPRPRRLNLLVRFP